MPERSHIFMFFDWFGVKVDQGNLLSLLIVRCGGNAWQTLEAIPIFLVLAIAIAVGAAMMRMAGSNWKPVVSPSVAVAVLGGLAALLILFRILPTRLQRVGRGRQVGRTDPLSRSLPRPRRGLRHRLRRLSGDAAGELSAIADGQGLRDGAARGRGRRRRPGLECLARASDTLAAF
jgi:hypothetical protein